MNTYLAKLEFQAPLAAGHDGPRSEREPLVRSDSLFGAICHTWAQLYGRESLEELLGSFDSAPPLLVSSLFAYSPAAYYLPKPLGRPLHEPEPHWASRLRRVAWLPVEHFHAWVHGGAVSWAKLLAAEPVGYAQTHAVVARARLAQDRRLNRAAPFRDNVIVFAPGCGGYIVVQTDSEEVANRLGRCLVLLGETGLGGRRSVGMGQFTVATGGLVPVPSEWAFMAAAGARSGVALSLYAPRAEETEALASRGAYRLCTRDGWAQSAPPRAPSKKQAMTMVEEGSVVPLPCRGQLVDVTPAAWAADGGHPVFRCGMPVVAPTRSAGGEA